MPKDDNVQAALESLIQELEARLTAVPQGGGRRPRPGGGSTVSTACCTHSCPCVAAEE